jgi:hypothetical protein
VSHISHHLSRTSKNYGHWQIHSPGAAFPFGIPVWNSPLVAQEFQMGGAWDRLYFYHLATDLLRWLSKPPRTSGQKKSGLNKGSAGITFVPGLFSELFNVAASRPAQMTTERAKFSPKRSQRQGKPLVNQDCLAGRH